MGETLLRRRPARARRVGLAARRAARGAVWFVWLEDAVYVSCRRHSRVWTNLVNDPRVVLELERGRSWKDQAGILVHGEAELLAPDEPGARRAMSAWFDKYTRDLGGEHFAAYAEQVSTPALFRVRPKRVSWWDHRSPAS